MPNWCDNDLTITGPKKSLDELVEQMKQPYQTIQQDWKTGEIKEETTEGEFLLWNIIRPIDTDAYFKLDEMKATQDKLAIAHLDPAPEPVVNPIEVISEKIKDFNKDFDMAKVIAQFTHDVENNDDWYNWNIRNWGTKWEVDATVSRPKSTEVGVHMSTAWSPPIEAIDKLAKQYPMLKLFMRSIEEGMGFACETTWENGERTDEVDLEINHELREEFFGSCHCEDEDMYDNEELAEMGCPPKEGR